MRLILILLLFYAPLYAEEAPIEEEVVIQQDEQKTIYEYRRNGQTYLIKIQPKIGPAYYLMDLDGDGDFENIGMDPFNPIMPQWTIFRW